MTELNDRKMRWMKQFVNSHLGTFRNGGQVGIPQRSGGIDVDAQRALDVTTSDKHRFRKKCFQIAHLFISVWFQLMGVLAFIAYPALILAHDSTEAVEIEIGDRERYLEITDQVAPIFALQDVDANPVRLDDFRGKVVIVNFFNQRCDKQCQLHITKLADVQQQLMLASVNDRVQFISIATDTGADTSTVKSMRALGLRYGMDPANWVLLQDSVESEDSGMGIAIKYGLNLIPIDDGEQLHRIITFLIDTNGQLRARYHDLRFNSVNLTLHASALIHDDHNKGDVKSIDSTPLYTKSMSIVLFAVFVSMTCLICIAIFYYWKRRRIGAGHSQISPSVGKH